MEIGDIIKGYTIKEYIGDGGMGIVLSSTYKCNFLGADNKQ